MSTPGANLVSGDVLRTLSLLGMGILMVHGTPDTEVLGWSGDAWCVLMYLSTLAAFSAITPPLVSSAAKANRAGIAGLALRLVGWAALVWLAFALRGASGQRIITLSPFSLDTRWYGILGLIGWAYLVTVIVFSVFRTNRTGILGSMALLLCLFAAAKTGAFDGFWLNGIVGIGGTLGSQASIAVGGLLLGSILTAADMTTLKARTSFTLCFVAGCATAALLLEGTYGISKNHATPSWCLWACAITAALWYLLHLISDVRPVGLVSRPLALAGQNVLLAYLISNLLPGLLNVLGLEAWYGGLAASLPSAIARSTLSGVVILALSISLNRLGFRLRL
jgi:hypothetical protein